MHPLHALDLAHEIDILRYPTLRPHNATQDHHGHLEKHFKLWCQALVDTGGWRNPFRETLEGLVDVSCAEVFYDAAGSAGGCSRCLMRVLVLVLVLRRTCAGFKRKRMRKNKNHMCKNGNGTVLLQSTLLSCLCFDGIIAPGDIRTRKAPARKPLTASVVTSSGGSISAFWLEGGGILTIVRILLASR